MSTIPRMPGATADVADRFEDITDSALRSGRRKTVHGADNGSDSDFVAFLKTLRRRLGLNEHLLMERFAVVTVVFAVFLAVIVTTATVVSIRNRSDQLSSQAVYTTSFKTSRSSVSGAVTGMYRSPDGTRAVVMMSLPAGMTAMSIDANTYQAFVSGGTLRGAVTPTSQTVAGQYAVYGTSGYMALVLDSQTVDSKTGATAPFKAELLAITMRANLEISDKVVGAQVNPREAESFALHDQWRIFENPGASGADVDPTLSSAGTPFDAMAFYRAHVVAPQVAKARSDGQTQLTKMQVDLARVAEYASRIATVSYKGMTLKPVAPPPTVAGDTVDAEADKVLRLNAGVTVPGGYSFDIGADDSVDGYCSATPASTVDSSSWQNLAVWQFTDGTGLDGLTGDPAAQPAITAVNDLQSAWSTYYADKSAYQKDLLGSLVLLCGRTAQIDGAASVNTATDTVKTY